MSCQGYQHFDEFDDVEYRINQVRENTKIIGKSNDWVTLCFMEALAIKDRVPVLNNGLKATKSLQLF